MNISINVKIYTYSECIFGELNNSSFRKLFVDVSKSEAVADPGLVGYSASVLDVIRPLCSMLRKILTSSQYLALLETISYTVRESLVRSENWFHATDYEDFSICVETKVMED